MTPVRRRIVFLVLLVAGAGYGYLSALQNQNPHYPPLGSDVPNAKRVKAWHWSPSPLWLPSYLLATVPRNGLGIRHTRSGYLFLNQQDRLIYFGGSLAIGAFLVALPAGVILVFIRRTVR